MAWPTAISALRQSQGKRVYAKDPQTDPPALVLEQFRVEPESIWNCFATGNQSMLNDAWFVPDVCKSPLGIWAGLSREGQKLKLCYAGVPTGEFASSWGMNFAMQ